MNLVIEKPEADGTVRVDIGGGPTRRSTRYVMQVLESLGLGTLAKRLKKGEWVDVAITQAAEIEALQKALG
jgi:hypothetical protein